MTSRIYNGYNRRYEEWCRSRDQSPNCPDALSTYKKYMIEEKQLSDRYVKGTLAVVRKKWFSASDDVREKSSLRRADRMLSFSDMQNLINECMLKYETDETALFMLLISLRPDLRPKILLQKINDPNERPHLKVYDIYADEERVANFNRFIREDLNFLKTPVLPKKLNSYLLKIKKRVGEILGKEMGDLVNLETLQRTNKYFKRKLPKKR